MIRSSEDVFQPIFQYLQELIQQYISSKADGNIQLHTEFSKHLLEIKCKLLEARTVSIARSEDNHKKMQEMKIVIGDLQQTLSDQQQEIYRLGRLLEEKERNLTDTRQQLELQLQKGVTDQAVNTDNDSYSRLISENKLLKRFVLELRDGAIALSEERRRLQLELQQAKLLLQALQATEGEDSFGEDDDEEVEDSDEDERGDEVVKEEEERLKSSYHRKNRHRYKEELEVEDEEDEEGFSREEKEELQSRRYRPGIAERYPHEDRY